MLTDPAPAPPGAGEVASSAAAALLGWDGLEMAELPIPVHALRPGDGAGGWDPALPLCGWAYPAFLDGRLACLAVAAADGGGEAFPAGKGTALGEALETAAGIAWSAPGPACLRLVRVPGAADAFWIEWGHDTFVPTDFPRAVPGPEFAWYARGAAGGRYGGDT